MSTTDSVSNSLFLPSTSSATSAANTTGSITTSSTTNDSSYSSLGKDDFLMLLVTQLNNQNPLDPMDNSEFVAQLAQFSSLESLTNIQTSMDGLYGSYQSSQALQASSLVGRDVMVSADKTYMDGSSAINGSLVIPSAADSISVKVYNSAGALVKTIALDSQTTSGTLDFSWDGTNQSGEAQPAGTYRFAASGSINDTATALTTYLPATVSSVTLGSGADDMTLNLQGVGSVPLSKVVSIGQ